MKPGRPITLYTNVSPSRGAVANLSSDDLRIPFRAPLEIDSIIFQTRCNATTTVVASRFISAVLRLRLSTMRRDVIGNSGEYVPICALHNRVQSIFETGTAGSTGNLVTGKVTSYMNYRFVPPCPIYVPRGDVLTGAVLHAADLDDPDTDSGFNDALHIGFVGRLLDVKAPPRLVRQPYATAWIASSNTKPISDENSLKNPFEVPLNVSRLTWNEWRASTKPSNRTEPNTVAIGGGAQYNLTDLVSISDGAGNSVTERPMPYPGAFDMACGGWPLSGLLAPHQRWIVSLSAAPSSGSRPIVGLIGWREERV